MDATQTGPPSVSTGLGNVELVRQLQDHGVAFVVVGGAAVAVHGCRDTSHFEELDILIDPAADNARRVIDALAAIDVRVQFSVADLAGPRKRIPVHFRKYRLDILT